MNVGAHEPWPIVSTQVEYLLCNACTVMNSACGIAEAVTPLESFLHLSRHNQDGENWAVFGGLGGPEVAAREFSSERVLLWFTQVAERF